MKTTAAILVETGRPLELAELELPPAGPGQVLVEITYSGVCHTQLLEARGHRGRDPWLPHCLGHEGSGVVVECGAGVSKCRPGDRVILSWIKGDGIDVPGSVFDWNGKKVNAGGVTTFSRHTLASENRLTVLPPDFDARVATLLGCAAATGLGAVFHTAAVRPGDRVAVFGAGGIGLCAIAAAVVSGAVPVMAVDVSPERLAVARALGAHVLIDGGRSDPVAAIGAQAPGGVDVAIEASGRPEVMAQALAAVRPRGGTAVVIGNAHQGEELRIDPGQLNQGKRLLGTWGGDTHPDRDFPRYARLITSGKLNFDALLSAPAYSLTEINRALDDLEARRVPRPLIDMRLQ